MDLKSKNSPAVLTQLFTLALSSALLITICFAPALAQQKDQINHDPAHYKRPIALSYLA
jgi:hypothetical protein